MTSVMMAAVLAVSLTALDELVERISTMLCIYGHTHTLAACWLGATRVVSNLRRYPE